MSGSLRALLYLLAAGIVPLALVPRVAGAADRLRFTDVTRAQVDRIVDSRYRFDAVFSDFNSDGCVDPFVFDHANPATSRLWLARCDGTPGFVHAGNDAVHHHIAEPAQLLGSGWITLLDFDGDSRQDLWLRHGNAEAARYVNATPAGNHVPRFSRKELACADRCVFADVDGDGQLDIVHPDRRVESMLGDRRDILPADGRHGALVAGDVDGDSWTDLVQPSAGGYWHNTHGKLGWRDAPGFKGRSDLLALADFDNDGDLDLIAFDGAECNEPDDESGLRLYRNDGRGGFSDVTATAGLSTLRYIHCQTNYGNLVAADFDNDGLPDLLVAASTPQYAILRNLGGMKFAASSARLGDAGGQAKARASVADFDNDGRIDILTTQGGTNLGLWRNATAVPAAHWMKVRVRGRGSNTDGVGTAISWYRAGSNRRIAYMEVQANSQHAQTWLHTGTGDASRVDMVVRFAHGGPRHRHRDLAADQEVIAFADGCLIEHWQPGKGWPRTAPADCTRRGEAVPDGAPQ